MKCEQRMLHPEIAPMESMDICFGLCLLWSLLALCSLFIFSIYSAGSVSCSPLSLHLLHTQKAKKEARGRISLPSCF